MVQSPLLETFHKHVDVALGHGSVVKMGLTIFSNPNDSMTLKKLQLLAHRRPQCLLGSVVPVRPSCGRFLRLRTTLPIRYRDQGGTGAEGPARRANGRGRCCEVAPRRAGLLGPRAVREFRTGRKERRRARSRRRYLEPAAASGVQLFGFFFFLEASFEALFRIPFAVPIVPGSSGVLRAGFPASLAGRLGPPGPCFSPGVGKAPSRVSPGPGRGAGGLSLGQQGGRERGQVRQSSLRFTLAVWGLPPFPAFLPGLWALKLPSMAAA